jgi:hypothetical protein
MQVPFDLLFGVDVALKKLRPHANFQLEGTQFTQWNDPTGSEPPSWDEVMAQLEADRQAYEEWQKNNLTR